MVQYWNFIEIRSSCPIDNKSTLVQLLTWRQPDGRALPEPVMAHLNYAYLCNVSSMILCVANVYNF